MVQRAFLSELLDILLQSMDNNKRFVSYGGNELPPQALWEWSVQGLDQTWILTVTDYRNKVNEDNYYMFAEDLYTWAVGRGLTTPQACFQTMVQETNDKQFPPKTLRRNQTLEPHRAFNVWTEEQFLSHLYEEMMRLSHCGIITSKSENYVDDEAEWRWIIHGDQGHWWIEVQDDRMPELIGRPYYLDPWGDSVFYTLASSMNQAHPDRIAYFVGAVLTYMDENLVGQDEAIRAYQKRGNSDAPPWIHSHNE